jgi:hypothetical protein
MGWLSGSMRRTKLLFSSSNKTRERDMLVLSKSKKIEPKDFIWLPLILSRQIPSFLNTQEKWWQPGMH